MKRSRMIDLKQAPADATRTILPRDYRMPQTRAECVDGPRPCLHLSCRYNLTLDVSDPVKRRIGPRGSQVRNIVINHPGHETGDPDEIDPPRDNCALDWAESDGMLLQEVGDVLWVTRQRIEQIERAARFRVRMNDRGRMREHAGIDTDRDVAAVPGFGRPMNAEEL